MADIAWPASLPSKPLGRGYVHHLESAVNRMEVEVGPARVWPTVRQQPRVIPVTWHMSEAQFLDFDRWFHLHLLGGARQFDILLDDGRADAWWTATFLDGYTGPFQDGYEIIVSANLYCVGPPAATRSDDVSFTALLSGGLRMFADGTQEILFTADLAGALTITAAGALNASVAFEALLDGELDVDASGVETPGTPGDPDGGDLERIWVALARTPVPGSEIDRSNQELLQRTWMGIHHGFH